MRLFRCKSCGTEHRSTEDSALPSRCCVASCKDELMEVTAVMPTALDKQVGGDHYKGDVIQHVEYCQRNKIPWCESAAIKYIVRHRKKNGVQDINKAIHYLELLKQLEYPEQ